MTIQTPQFKKKGHRFFARNYDRSVAMFEEKFGPDYRGGLIGKLQGKVLEVGVGTGANFPYYNFKNIDLIVGIDPDQYMLEQAQAKQAALGLKLPLIDATAENLPFADQSFDAVVSTLVLCTVSNPIVALKEIRRVLKPEGKLYFFEHVGSHNRLGRTFQIALNPLWGLAVGGCHLNRDTANLIAQTGFKFDLIKTLKLVPLNPINPQIWGIASLNNPGY